MYFFYLHFGVHSAKIQHFMLEMQVMAGYGRLLSVILKKERKEERGERFLVEKGEPMAPPVLQRYLPPYEV